MSDCPPTPPATQSLLERIAFIRPTHYGGFWDFTSSSSPTDTAYTNQPLAVHTDTTYLLDPCGLQMFHLISHTDGTGGESLFVDGYAAAAYLRDHHPVLYTFLCHQTILFHASGNTDVGELENTSISKRGSVVFVGGLPRATRYPPANVPAGLKGEFIEFIDRRRVPIQIRWNNDDRDAQTWPSLNSLVRWYTAAREWDKILKMKQFEIKVQLKPGQPIIFDNWRYLHGRTGFSGKRRVCGGYSKLSSPCPYYCLPSCFWCSAACPRKMKNRIRPQSLTSTMSHLAAERHSFVRIYSPPSGGNQNVFIHCSGT